MSDKHRALRESDCVECGEQLDGADIMIPEGEGPMHAECWKDWMLSQE